MVQQGAGAIMPQMDDRSLPSLPSEEEERALGIRRPAFIPATEERRGRKPSRGRIVSGALSMIVLVLFSCGISVLLVQKNVVPSLSRLLGITTPSGINPPVATVPAIYLTPAAIVTPSGKASPITSFGVYKKIVEGPGAGPVTPQNPSALFIVGDNIYVVMEVSEDSKTNDVISVRWTFNGVDITDNLKRTKADCCSATIAKDNTNWQESFLLAPPTSGLGKVDVYYNKDLMYTALFDVVVPVNTPTPVPPTATPGAPAPTATAGK